MHRRNQFGRTQRGLLIRLHLTVRSGIVFFPIKRIQPNSRGENKVAPPPTLAMDDRCSKTLMNHRRSPPSPLVAALAVGHRRSPSSPPAFLIGFMHATTCTRGCRLASPAPGDMAASPVAPAAGRSTCRCGRAVPRRVPTPGLLLVPTKNDTSCSKKVYRFQQKSLPLQPAVVIVAKMLTGCSFCGCRLQQKNDVVVANTKKTKKVFIVFKKASTVVWKSFNRV